MKYGSDKAEEKYTLRNVSTDTIAKIRQEMMEQGLIESAATKQVMAKKYGDINDE